MTNRREFVRGSLALSTLGAVGFKSALASAAAEGPTAAANNLLAIADRSFVASAEFAAETTRQGVDARGFDGDVGGLWLREIEPALRAGGVAIVGLSGAGVLFCLETMARSYGLAPVFRAERPQSGGAGWARVTTRHALAAVAGGAAMLAPFAHVAHPAAQDAPLFAWTIVPDARRANQR